MSKLGRARRTRDERLADRLSRSADVEAERAAFELERAKFWARLTKDRPEVKS